MGLSNSPEQSSGPDVSLERIAPVDIEIDPEKAQEHADEVKAQAEALKAAEEAAKQEEGTPEETLETDLATVIDGDDESYFENQLDSALEQGGFNKKEDLQTADQPGETPPTTTTASTEGTETPGKKPESDAEAISKLGETINAASLGMAKEIATAVETARSKNQESLPFKSAFLLLILQTLSKLTGSASWVKDLSARELKLLSDKRVGMKVAKGPDGKAKAGPDGKYKIEWDEGVDINVEAMDVFEQAYGGGEYLKKLELVKDDTTLKDLQKSEDFGPNDKVVRALIEEGAESDTKVLDFIKKNRQGLMDELTKVEGEGDQEKEAATPATAEEPAEKAPAEEAVPDEAEESVPEPEEAPEPEPSNLLAKSSEEVKKFMEMNPEKRKAYTIKTLKLFETQLKETDPKKLLRPENLYELAGMMAVIRLGLKERADGPKNFAALKEKLEVKLEEAKQGSTSWPAEGLTPVEVVQNASDELIQSAVA